VQVFFAGDFNLQAFQRCGDKNLAIHHPNAEQFIVPQFVLAMFMR